MVAAAAVGAAAIGAGASIYAGKKGANAQTDYSRQAIEAQMNMFNQVRGDLAPYRDAGAGALPYLNKLISGDPAEVQAQLEMLPGYQFSRTQGLKAVQNSAAARGLGVSGAALKGAADFATGLADNTFGSQYNRLMGVAQLGENAAAQTGSFGTQTAANVGNNLVGIGNAQAGNYLNAGNAVAGGANSVGNLYLLNSLMKSQGGTGLFGQG